MNQSEIDPEIQACRDAIEGALNDESQGMGEVADALFRYVSVLERRMRLPQFRPHDPEDGAPRPTGWYISGDPVEGSDGFSLVGLIEGPSHLNHNRPFVVYSGERRELLGFASEGVLDHEILKVVREQNREATRIMWVA
jgi:hypothetical protein